MPSIKALCDNTCIKVNTTNTLYKENTFCQQKLYVGSIFLDRCFLNFIGFFPRHHYQYFINGIEGRPFFWKIVPAIIQHILGRDEKGVNERTQINMSLMSINASTSQQCPLTTVYLQTRLDLFEHVITLNFLLSTITNHADESSKWVGEAILV